MTEDKIGKVVLLISCPDRKGIVARVSNFILSKGGNILQSDQYTTDPRNGVFFLRVEFDLSDVSIRRADLEGEFGRLASEFKMDWRMTYPQDTKRMAIMVSRQGHCLVDLLWRWKTGELRAPSSVPFMCASVSPSSTASTSTCVIIHSCVVSVASKRYARPGTATRIGGPCCSMIRICAGDVCVRRSTGRRPSASWSTQSVSHMSRAG